MVLGVEVFERMLFVIYHGLPSLEDACWLDCEALRLPWNVGEGIKNDPERESRY